MMSENFRQKVNTHACEDNCRRHSEQTSLNSVISFDRRKGYYSIGSSGLSFDYWYKTSNESINEDSLITDNGSYKEVPIEDCGTENWYSDEEEMFPTHPETPMEPSLNTAESWGHHNNDSDYCYNDNHRQLDVTTEDDIILTCDFTNDQLMTFGEEQTESDSPYTVVLPYTGISRDIKGAGVGLTIHGGFSSNQGLVAIVTEVEYTGPAFIIGSITAGCIIHEWNGVSLLKKSYEQTKEILSRRILGNELNLLVCNSSDTEILDVLEVEQGRSYLETGLKKTDKDFRRRQSVISCSSQREWVFEESVTKVEYDALMESEAIEQGHGCVRLSMMQSRTKLQVTLHQGKLLSKTPINPLASINLIGEGLSNPDELLASQVSATLSQTISPVWNHKFELLRLPEKLFSCTGLHLIIWDCESDKEYSFVGEVFLNLLAESQNTAPTWYSLASHDPNLPQLATPAGVKKSVTIKVTDRGVSLNSKQELLSVNNTTRKRSPLSLFKRLKNTKGIAGRKSDKNSRMLVMRPKVAVINESTSAECDSQSSCRQQLPRHGMDQQLYNNKQEPLFADHLSSGRSVEVEAVVEPHAYQPAWGLETEVHKKPNPDMHGFEVRQEQLGSPSSGYTSVQPSETSSTDRNSGFSNYSTSSSTESPDVMWHEEDETGIKCSTMVRRSCSMSSFPVMGGNSSEYEALQKQSRKPSQDSTNSDQPMDDLPRRLKPGHRSRSVEILMDTDSSTELSQADATSCSSCQEEAAASRITSDQRPENLIMSFKMKYSAVQQPAAPQKSRAFFIKAKKIRAPFRLFRSKHTSDSSQANKSIPSSTSSVSSSPEGSKVCLTQQRKELGIGQFIPKLDHLQEPCGRIRFSLVQHRRLLLKIRTVEERSPTVSANECGIKATLVEGKEVICKKKVSTTLNSATNPLAEMYLDSHGRTDRMHLHIVITKGSRLSRKYVGEVWVNMKWADLSGLSSWYQLYT